MCIYICILFDLYILFFSPISTVDRPSHSQYVLSLLSHAAHTPLIAITFCNALMRFDQSNNLNIFISNVFYIVVYSCISLD